MISHGLPPAGIQEVIDSDSAAVASANAHGLAAFEGDATSRDLLRRAELSKAKEITITVGRDDTAILSTLTARQLNRGAHLVVAVRDSAEVLQAGDEVIVIRRAPEAGSRG